MRISSHSAFTLIELLVVIGIIAILAVAVILTVNPAALLQQSRDARRLSDLTTIANSINLYISQQGGSAGYFLGTSSTIYVSVPDPTATTTAGTNCSGVGLTGSYHCAASSTLRSINGLGWIPVNFSSISGGSPIGILPVDPTNNTSSGLYYQYATDGVNNWQVAATPESQKYASQATSSFTAGTTRSLLALGGTGRTFTYVAQSSVYVGPNNNTGVTSTNYTCASGDFLAMFVFGNDNSENDGENIVLKSSTGGNTVTRYSAGVGGNSFYFDNDLDNTASGQWFGVASCNGNPSTFSFYDSGNEANQLNAVFLEYSVSSGGPPVFDTYNTGYQYSGASSCSITPSGSGELLLFANLYNPTSSITGAPNALGGTNSRVTFSNTVSGGGYGGFRLSDIISSASGQTTATGTTSGPQGCYTIALK